jgi:two-component system, LytTR family, response regulator
VKVAVIEDSELAREGLVSMLAAYPDLELVCAADHTDSALEVLNATPADVLFLDIHMPGSSGFELLANLKYSPLIVFTTAYSEYAIRSFDFNTVDYLLKPISRQRLDQAIVKLRRHHAAVFGSFGTQPEPENFQAGTQQPLEPGSRLFIRDNDRCYLIELASIRYFESCKNEARAFFDDNRAFIKRSMSELERRLPATFFRANRQYIVNLQAVKSIEESLSAGFSLVMSDGKTIEISRRRATQLAEMLRL